jgi:hypothetical protein
MARTHDELEWTPVEVLWDERVPGDSGQWWERPATQPAHQERPDPQARRVRPFRDDAREPSEKFGRRRERDASKRRKNKVRFEDFEDEAF